MKCQNSKGTSRTEQKKVVKKQNPKNDKNLLYVSKSPKRAETERQTGRKEGEIQRDEKAMA